MYKKFFLAASCLMFACFSAPAQAETWEDVKPRVEEMLSQKPIPCDQLWNEIWPWFKRGEAEVILALAMGGAGMADIFPPLSVSETQNRAERYALTVYWQLAQGGMLRASLVPKIADVSLKTYEEYASCAQPHSRMDCAETAVAQGDVPRFDDFVSVIEGRVQAGHKAMCKD